jgi:hypothetical protein
MMCICMFYKYKYLFLLEKILKIKTKFEKEMFKWSSILNFDYLEVSSDW